MTNVQSGRADRRAFLTATLAAGAAAITPVRAEAASEAPEEAATDEQWAALAFEPLGAATLESIKPPSNEKWFEQSPNRLLVPARFAWLILSKTKDELKEIIRAAGTEDDSMGAELLASFDEAEKFCRGMAHMLSNASTRCFSVAAQLEIEETAR